ncbi:MAG: glycosyltransferase family 4 protein [Pontiellaceae bacterium]|nr:glycosyltransferase family 4 protein [Pontiellaceae bacterium]MBN2786349.1 glycosyltransferase family 4 protein [Pontiellaceae bacterium]
MNLRPGKVGGIETYIRKVVEYASQVVGEDEVVFFVHRDNIHAVPGSQQVVVADYSQREIDVFRALEAFTLWRARSIERLIDEARIDAMFYTQQTIFPVDCRIPSLLFVADVQYLIYPQYFSWADRQFRNRSYLRSMQRADSITTVSQFTADHLMKHCGVAPEKITVIHHGVDAVSALPDESDEEAARPFIYYPAASYPHKGHEQLFRSFAELKRRGLIKQRLLLSGEQTAHWNRLEQIIREESMEGEIIHLGYIAYATVLALYRQADAIVFPSEFEGFGLPVLEAVQFEKKIVCSRLPTFSELGVPQEWQIDFFNPDELLLVLNRKGPTRLARSPLTWREAVRQTLELVKDAGA